MIQIGNSAGVIIPRKLRQELKIRVGENIFLDKKGDKLVLSNPKKKTVSGVNVKFMGMVDEFMDEHEDVLQELAKR